MASQPSSSDLVSDRYASALYDLVAEKKIVDPVLEDLTFLQNCILENKDLKLLVRSPLISSSDKLNIFEKILSKKKTDVLTNTFLKVISSNKRFAKLSSIVSQFININSLKRGDVLADVTSAEELTNNQKKEITDQLKSTLGEKLSLNYYVDKKIIGGLIVKVDSKMVDSSLATKINKLRIAIEGAQWK